MESVFSNNSATPSLSTKRVADEMGGFSYEYVFQIIVLNTVSGMDILKSRGSVVDKVCPYIMEGVVVRVRFGREEVKVNIVKWFKGRHWYLVV